MFDLIAQTFNASLVAVTQLFLSAVVTSNPWFATLEVQHDATKHEVICSTRLEDSFTETLDDVLLSGQNITLHFVFEFYEAGQATPLNRLEVVNGFRYDKEAEIYYLFSSQTRKLDKYFTLEAAKDAYITVQNLTAMNTDDLSPSSEYFLKVTAFLDPIKMDDVGKSVNLMLRWASVKPTIATEKFKLELAST
jgi:hypothetical protein